MIPDLGRPKLREWTGNGRGALQTFPPPRNGRALVSATIARLWQSVELVMILPDPFLRLHTLLLSILLAPVPKNSTQLLRG
jgi:hypothetical protein